MENLALLNLHKFIMRNSWKFPKIIYSHPDKSGENCSTSAADDWTEHCPNRHDKAHAKALQHAAYRRNIYERKSLRPTASPWESPRKKPARLLPPPVHTQRSDNVKQLLRLYLLTKSTGRYTWHFLPQWQVSLSAVENTAPYINIVI